MKLSIFGDLHYSRNYRKVPKFEEIRNKYYYNLIHQLFSQQADYYVSIGDLTNAGQVDELEEIYALISNFEQGENFRHVIGNHDLYSLPKKIISQTIDKPLYYARTMGNLCFIVLDTTREMNREDWSGYIDHKQFDWLQDILAENYDKTVIILAHHPVYGTTFDSTADKASIIPEIPIKGVLDQHPGKGFYLNGHVHIDSITEIGHWHYIQIADVINQPTIRNITIEDDSFQIDTIQIDEYHRQLGTWLGANMEFFALSHASYQGEENRNITVTY